MTEYILHVDARPLWCSRHDIQCELKVEGSLYPYWQCPRCQEEFIDALRQLDAEVPSRTLSRQGVSVSTYVPPDAVGSTRESPDGLVPPFECER